LNACISTRVRWRMSRYCSAVRKRGRRTVQEGGRRNELAAALLLVEAGLGVAGEVVA